MERYFGETNFSGTVTKAIAYNVSHPRTTGGVIIKSYVKVPTTRCPLSLKQSMTSSEPHRNQTIALAQKAVSL